MLNFFLNFSSQLDNEYIISGNLWYKDYDNSKSCHETAKLANINVGDSTSHPVLPYTLSKS